MDAAGFRLLSGDHFHRHDLSHSSDDGPDVRRYHRPDNVGEDHRHLDHAGLGHVQMVLHDGVQRRICPAQKQTDGNTSSRIGGVRELGRRVYVQLFEANAKHQPLVYVQRYGCGFFHNRQPPVDLSKGVM